MGSLARIMRPAGTVNVAAQTVQECSTESRYKESWTCKDFANVRRRGEDKPQSWLQDTGRADGKKSRRRAWSSKGKGEAKQTTLGVNATRHWPAAPKVNKPGAPPWPSSRSSQLLEPHIKFQYMYVYIVYFVSLKCRKMVLVWR